MKKSWILAAALAAVPAAAAFAQKAELEPVKRAVHVCESCHGESGRSTNALYPPLAGQMRDYMIRQLKDFRSQSRAETDIQAYMWGISALLSDDVIEGLAEHYAAQTPKPAKSTNAKLEAAGRQIFDKGIPAKKVIACAQCHGSNAEGAAGFPRLAGLPVDYVMRQMRAFRTPLRPHGILMKNEIAGLEDAQLRAVAAYVASR